MPNIPCCSDPSCWGCAGAPTTQPSGPSPTLLEFGFNWACTSYPELAVRWAAMPAANGYNVYFDNRLVASPKVAYHGVTLHWEQIPTSVKVTTVYSWGESAPAEVRPRDSLATPAGGWPAAVEPVQPQGLGLEKLPRIVLAAPTAKDPCPRHYTGDPELPCRCKS